MSVVKQSNSTAAMEHCPSPNLHLIVPLRLIVGRVQARRQRGDGLVCAHLCATFALTLSRQLHQGHLCLSSLFVMLALIAVSDRGLSPKSVS